MCTRLWVLISMRSFLHFTFLLIITVLYAIDGTSLKLKSEKVNVFTKGENGYFCIKIPDLILTINGTLIAFGEGRMGSCSDFTWTDLIYKRSTDNGKTWSSLQILRSNSTINDTNTIGNAAPIQCNITKRILIPHCRNNKEVWLIYSDDDGMTWSKPIGPLTHLVHKDWAWIALGPPAGLRLESNNRIIVACDHSIYPQNNTEGEVSKGHFIYSDDYGNSWNISAGIYGFGPNGSSIEYFPNESQAVELKNGSLLINSRGHKKYRIGTISNDFGNTFEPSFLFNDLLEEKGGCEGSMIKHSLSKYLYFSGITPQIDATESLRYNLTVYISKNEGNTWEYIETVDVWSSAYSALVSLEKQSNDKQDTIAILYENAEIVRTVFIPDHISFQILTFQH
eukprot:190717_1